jgi:methionyl-tRNA synthetase
VNKDLADVLGNFVLRVTKFCAARFDGRMPGEGVYGDEEKALIAELDRRVGAYTGHLEAAEFRKALGELRAIWVAGNEYLTRAAPWTHIKTDRDRAAAAVRMGLNLIHIFAHLSWPVMPDLAARIHRAIQPIGYAGGAIPWPEGPMTEELDQLEPGQPITPPDVLVAKIADEQVEAWKQTFGGAP